jgi:hypothetical protein
MSLNLTSDISGPLGSLDSLAKAAAAANGYSSAIVNSKSYAPAVEQGYTQTRFWKDMSKGQRYAILMAMKKRGKSASYKREGTEVKHFDNPKGFKIHVPGEGMVSKSLPEIGQFMHKLAGSVSLLGSPRPFERIVDETALYGLIPITEKTPVNVGGAGLAGAWDVKLGYSR